MRRGRAGGPPGMLRIISGELGGRRLEVARSDATRPTSERVREAMFNALESLGVVEGARVLDPFAGTGALGLEALSRGASEVVFAESDATARAALTRNVLALGLESKATVLATTGERTVESSGGFGLILLDPPYRYEGWTALLEAVAGRLEPDGVVVIESDREVVLPVPLVGIRTKTYGGTVVQFATCPGAST